MVRWKGEKADSPQLMHEGLAYRGDIAGPFFLFCGISSWRTLFLGGSRVKLRGIAAGGAGSSTTTADRLGADHGTSSFRIDMCVIDRDADNGVGAERGSRRIARGVW